MTLEITKETHLTPRGDCIVGVGAHSGCAGLPEDLKNKLRNPDSKVTIQVIADGHKFEINGMGHPDLTLSHPEDIVIRKSDFVCPRTLAIKCDKASDIMPREMVAALQNPDIKGTFSIIVE